MGTTGMDIADTDITVMGFIGRGITGAGTTGMFVTWRQLWQAGAVASLPGQTTTTPSVIGRGWSLGSYLWWESLTEKQSQGENF